jgi:hypothetical protein
MEEDSTTVTVRSNEPSGTCARCHLLKVSSKKEGEKGRRGRKEGREGGSAIARAGGSRRAEGRGNNHASIKRRHAYSSTHKTSPPLLPYPPLPLGPMWADVSLRQVC